MLVEKSMQAEPSAPANASPRGTLLLRVMETLEQAGIPICILHGYEQYPQTVGADVDCLVPPQFVPLALARALHLGADKSGARIVQWFEDGAHFIVLAGRDTDGSPVLLQLHVSSHYEMGGRTFFGAEEILESRRPKAGFWIPSAAMEFSCVLVNRLAKRKLTDDHARQLSALFSQDPAGCRERAENLLGAESARLVVQAADSGAWQPVLQNISELSREILASPCSRPAGKALARLTGKLRRWLRPRNGFHAVFLGPDGVGKSTTIEAFQRDLAPAFLHSAYLTFAPGLIPQKFAAPKPDGPHSLAPRSLPASLLKAAWWAVCYTAGYALTIRPTLARAGLVVNHRYLVDAIVDQKRYRYSGPVWLLKVIWAIAPKPDVVFLLDAAPEVIQKRKQEVPFAETARQVQAYRTVIGKLDIGKIIDGSQPRRQVASEVEWLVLDRMADRTERRFKLGGA